VNAVRTQMAMRTMACSFSLLAWRKYHRDILSARALSAKVSALSWWVYRRAADGAGAVAARPSSNEDLSHIASTREASWQPYVLMFELCAWSFRWRFVDAAECGAPSHRTRWSGGPGS
jgi:hypothetical protein